MNKINKPVTLAYLEKAALFYLERYSSSKANLRRVLDRKIRRRKEDMSGPSDSELEWIDDVISKCESLGYVNDLVYAQQKIASMQQSGKSVRAMRHYLASKGVVKEDVEQALFLFADAVVQNHRDSKHTALTTEDVQHKISLKAAIVYARKRGFGPYRMKETDEQRHQKDIAAMMRAGHEYDDIQKVLQASSKESIERLFYSLDL